MTATSSDATLLHPPPWASVYDLFNKAIILQVLLIALALARAVLNPFFSPVLSHSSMSVGYDKDVIARWIKALGGSLDELTPLFSLLRIVLSSVLCILYIVTTYLEHIPPAIHFFQALCGVLFLLRSIGRLFLSHAPLSLALRPSTIVESLSTTSLIFARQSVWLHFGFLQAYVILWHFETLEANRYIVVHESPVARKLTNLSITFIVFIYVFACGFQLFELLGDPHDALKSTTFELTVANALYLCVATIFTVGYGDFIPQTLLGRMWIVLVILFGAYLVARQVSQVIDVVASLRKGMGSFVKSEDTSHIILCGNVKFTHLRTFIAEFYAVPSNRDTKIVVMTTNPEWTEDQWNSYFGSSAYKTMVVYLEGNCTTKEDLVRAQVETAASAFIMCNQHAKDPYLEDTETLKRILMLRSYGPSLPIYAMCALKDSMLQFSFALEHVSEDYQSQFHSQSQSEFHEILGETLDQGSFYDDYAHNDDDDDDYMVVTNYDGTSDVKSEALCLQEVESSLLAENVFCHGLSTLLSNLLLRVGPETKASDSAWMAEYKVGAECRLEHIKLPSPLWRKSVNDVHLILFDYGLILIAVKRHADQKWRPVTLETTIQLNMIGLVITYHGPTYLEQVVDHAAMYIKNRDHGSNTSSKSPSTQTDGTVEHEVSDPPGGIEDVLGHPAETPVLSSTPVPRNDALTEFLKDDDSMDSPKSYFGPARDFSRDVDCSNSARPEGLSSKSPGEVEPVEENSVKLDNRPSPGPRMRAPPKEFAMSHRLTSEKSIDLPHLREHIVVCVLGRVGVLNLRHFINRVSLNRSNCSLKPQVVAVSSHMTMQDEKLLQDQKSGLKLHFIRGPCMSLKSLKSAQYKSAKAIVVLACEDSNDGAAESVDSKAIFTVLTLDYLLGEYSQVFVCATIDAEESMGLLRAPEYARRIGSSLIRPLSRSPVSRRDLGGAIYGNRRIGAIARHMSSTSIPASAMSPLMLSSTRSFSSNLYSGRSSARSPSLVAGFKQNLQTNLNQSLLGDENGTEEGRERVKTFRNREEIYERQRYASGELIISSLYVALLIREHATPGLMDILCTIFGANIGERSTDSHCWVRLVKVSEQWIRRERRSRTFREVVQCLLQHGCITLGLYRTGTVPIRVEVDESKLRNSEGKNQGGHDPFSDDEQYPSGFSLGYGSMGRVTEGEKDQSESQETQPWNADRPSSGCPPSGSERPSESSGPNVYVCPTTNHRQVFEEREGGGNNVLPYVYTFPEPFSLVDESDSIYVLAHPSLKIPKVW